MFALVAVRLVNAAVIPFKSVVKRLVEVAEVNIGVSVNAYVTRPVEVVATVRF
jgi:hypothetical protein